MALAAESLQPILSVGELTRRIKKSIEETIRHVWVSGEISNCRPASSGHIYFTLKDEESQIPCVIWKGIAARLPFQPKDGAQVLACGKVDVFIPYGKYQLLVEELQPRGTGTLQIKFEQLKEKLRSEGLFDAGRKRPLPFFPRRIALVTSPTGAALQDMLRTIAGRCGVVHVLVCPVRVQGDGAAQEIAAAIDHLNLAFPDLDAMIVGRGGGSIEDLWAFNEEVVARAIFASRIPVISAVGHETDTTIADFVADVRALTPTDGAVRIVPRLDNLVLALDDFSEKLRRGLKTSADLTRSRLDGLRDGHVLGRIADLPHQFSQRLDDLRERLDAGAGQPSYYLRQRLDLLKASLFADLPRLSEGTRERVAHLAELLQSCVRHAVEGGTACLRESAAALEALSPVAILARGYSVTRIESSQEILKDARQARPGDRILSILGAGRLVSRVEND
jgi:exodeoxyribonuclease VII large subunit